MKKLREAEKDSSAIKISRNRSSGKKKIDLFARLRNDEHPIDNLFHSESDNSEPLQPPPNSSNVIQSNVTSSNVISSNENRRKNTPTSPEKDFQKVPNSLTRNAIPDKLFIGTSKYTYDALYLKTRGAIKPQRTVKATKRELMTWIGISDVTLFKHIKHLQSVGLLKVEFRLGSHEGATYEVFIPEEIKPLQTPPNPSNVIQSKDIQSNVIEPKKVGGDLSKKVLEDWMGNPIANKDTCEIPKTSLKTNTSDDDALVDFASVMNELSRKFTNKDLNRNEKEKWKDLANLLAMELEIAAARTNSISSIPAFLTEHLRRRLTQKISIREVKASRSLVDESIESNSVVYEAEALSQQGREVVLETFIEYVKKGQKDFVLSFEETYTKEDWRFLMENLKQ